MSDLIQRTEQSVEKTVVPEGTYLPRGARHIGRPEPKISAPVSWRVALIAILLLSFVFW